MKSCFFISILCILMLLIGMYGRISDNKFEYNQKDIISVQSPNHKFNAKIIPFYKNTWLSVSGKIDLYINNDKKQYVQTIILETEDINIQPPTLVWKNNNELDIFIPNKDNKNTKGEIKYFFKKLGNIIVTVHYSN